MIGVAYEPIFNYHMIGVAYEPIFNYHMIGAGTQVCHVWPYFDYRLSVK